MHSIRDRLKKKCKTATKSLKTQLINLVHHINTKHQSKNTTKNISHNHHKTIFNAKSTCSSFKYDKFSWTVGTTILVHERNIIHQCMIQKITKFPDPLSSPQRDIISVQFEDGNTASFHRYDNNIQSDPIFIANRYKLTRYCVIDKYSSTLNQWIPHYIDDWGYISGIKTRKDVTGNIFSVKGQNYKRWSHEIRPSPLLLQLGKDSSIFVFDCDIHQWCYGKIMDIVDIKHCVPSKGKKNKHNLDIFNVYYQKNGKLYSKYVHQFSANIAMRDNLIHNEYTMIEEDAKSPIIDKTDLKYYRLLLQGLIRTELRDDDKDIFINNDLLSLLVNCIGCLYEMVMATEAGTWSLAMKNKDKNMIPKFSAIHNGRLVLYDSSSNEQPIPSEYVVNTTDILSTHNNSNCGSISTLDIITEEELVQTTDNIKSSKMITNQKLALNPNAPKFIPFTTDNNNNNNNITKAKKTNKNENVTRSKKKKKSQNKSHKQQHDPYRSKCAQNMQQRVRIPRKLTGSVTTCIKEHISDIYHYMLTINTLQFMEEQGKEDEIKIINYNLHDRNDNTLYGVAKRQNIRNYHWWMENTLFLAEEILNEWPNSTIPPIVKLQQVSNSIGDQQKIKAFLMNTDIFKEMINNTNWCKIKVFNRVNNTERMVLKPTKEKFVKKCIEFIDQQNDIYLIPILMINNHNKHSIEYVYIIRYIIDIGIGIDIGISLKYDDKNRNIKVGGIHIDKQYIINQHELAHPKCQCKYLDQFVSFIDDINIGNPDSEINKRRDVEKRLKELQKNKN